MSNNQPSELQDQIDLILHDERNKFQAMLTSVETGWITKLHAANEQIKKMAKGFEEIKAYCEKSGLKEAAIDNPIHMAIYHSVHLAEQCIVEYNKYKAQEDATGL